LTDVVAKRDCRAMGLGDDRVRMSSARPLLRRHHLRAKGPVASALATLACGTHCLDHALNVRIRHARATGEAQAGLEDALRHRTPAHGAASKRGLKMHRL